ncbi:MAG: type I polyketide synthase, partial [Betaproteobacteria bacterium]
LELSWEALENANIPPEGLKNSRTGVYIGISGDDYALNHRHSHEPCAIDAYSITGSTFSTAAGRISYILGLQGPCMAIDTACSSSLVALHQACRSLQANESNLALVGGVNLIIHPEMHIGFSKLQAISPNGRCKTFDASANGYVRSEGCSMIVLKRLEDALQNRDHILAVVEGSAINQDGKTNGLAAPNGLAQQAVITEALQNARILPNQVQYLEAHGTGTILGDPIEVEALGATYGLNRSSTLFLGSVKTNIGHLEPVAGMAGILKIILSLNNQILPKNLHFQNPNPHIQWETLPFEVLQKNEVWPLTNQVTRYAAVSSFGFSGTNAHVILSESPLPLPTLTKLKQPTQVILLSAKDKKSLQELVNVYLAEMQKRAIDLDALSFSTACGRTHWQERLAFIVSSQNDLINQLQSYLINESKHDLIFKQGIDHKNQLAILFTGQGSQYHRMGCDLYESELVFKNAFLECNDILEPIIQQSIKRLLFEENSELIHQTEFTQPLLFAIEYSLYQLWKSWGVHPQYLMGHSVGEYVAACVADVFSLQDGLHLIAKRGQLMQALPKGGGMLAVLASVEELTPYLLTYENKIDIAAINGVNQTVLAGKLVDLERLETTLNDQQLSAQLLSVSHAFHSFLMQDMLEDYRKILSTIRFSSPKIPIISNLTGDIADHAITSVDYWLKHVMQPVEFVKGVQTLEKLGINTILEIGPDPTLIGLAKKLLPPATLFLPSLKRQTVDTEQM